MKPTSACWLVSASTDLAAVSNSTKVTPTPSSLANARARSIDTPAGFSRTVWLRARTGLPRLSAARRLPVGANSLIGERSMAVARWSGYCLPGRSRFSRAEQTCKVVGEAVRIAWPARREIAAVERRETDVGPGWRISRQCKRSGEEIRRAGQSGADFLLNRCRVGAVVAPGTAQSAPRLSVPGPGSER